MSAAPSAPAPAASSTPATAAPGISEDVRPVRRALVSVYDKTGLELLVRGLHDAGVVIVSTGGSAALVESLGIPVTRVEELTGFPECLEGRVKTLHPAVHAGILADTRKPDHLAQLEQLGIEPFELVVVNLYPFTATVASGATPDECVEQIDIGGPSMVRAAAKNHPSVAVVTDPARYAEVLDAVRGGGFTLRQRMAYAAEAFVHTATYDVHVASWMGTTYTDTSDGTGFPGWVGATWDQAAVLRYGENPHQRAALYTSGFQSEPGLAQARQLHGKEMSYNNYVDADAAVRAAHDHGDQPTVAIIKHANPCGIAVGGDIAAAYRAAHACDPVSAFGGIIASNRPVSAAMAAAAVDVFTEVIIAPSYDAEALEILTTKKNLRLLECPSPLRGGVETRPISGGLLMQVRDTIDAEARDDHGSVTGGDDPANWRLVAGDPADDATLADLAFAWRAVRAVKSNAILLACGGASVGIGMGQVNRVDSCHLAVSRAGADRARGAVASSDAFFPFADGLQVLLDAGVRAVVAPGGSMRDAEVVQAAQDAGVILYFTGTRHFAH
ncbi:MAG: bifunctional phosphoribosylaminoimidazolecarboxamide formyltransferase/IMP cyclohydrolase [Dermatophilaceae bacterium]